MKDNKELKIKLKTAVILIIISLIAVLLVVSIIFISKKQIDTVEDESIVASNETDRQTDKQQVTQTEFPIKFLKLENNKQNIVYSPLSIKYALKMLNEGANGNTKKQIENVIEKQDLTKYNNIDKILSLANGVYIRDTYAKYVKEDYRGTLNKKYNAEINYDSFNNANNINKWIENKTLGIIKDMVQDEIVQDIDSKMLLINSLAINMEWKDPFDAKDTRGSDFYLENGSKINATTMNKKTSSDSVSYYKNKDITALAMDLKKYDNTQLEFVAIMPEESLSNYVETFSIENFDNIIKNMTLASKTKYGLDISIPRFSFDYNLELKDDLVKLGITDAFDKKLADFSKMADTADTGLYVGNAVHKSNIDFTEKGIKAAATTVIAMMEKSMAIVENKPIVINIDKPFLYIIRDKNTDEIWFIGTVYAPNSWEVDSANYQYR